MSLLQRADQPVQFRRGDSAPPVLENRSHRCGQAHESRPGLRRHPQYRRPVDEGEAISDRVLGVETLLFIPDIPFVQDQDHPDTGPDDLFSEALLLVGCSQRAVDHQECHVRLVENPPGPHHRVFLDIVVDLRPPLDARGIDDLERLAVQIDDEVDRVACRAGYIRDQDAVLPGELVQQRRLADVRPADDREARDHVIRNRFAEIRKRLDKTIEQISGIASVQRRDRQGLTQAKRPEMCKIQLDGGTVHLVRHEQVRDAAALQDSSDANVIVGDLRRAVGHEDDNVCTGDRYLGLLPDVCRQLLSRPELPPTGVHDREVAPAPVGAELPPIPRDTCLFIHNGCLLTHHAVHERRLADIRATKDDYDRKSTHAAAPSMRPQPVAGVTMIGT